MEKKHELTLAQFKKIEDLLLGRKGTEGPTIDNHQFLNAVFWYLKRVCPWRDVPKRYGHWKTAHKSFSRWCKAGIFQK